MNIRPVTEGDIDRLATLMQGLLQDDPEELPCDREALIKKIHDAIESPGEVELFVLCENDGFISGYFVLAFGYSLEFGGRYVCIDEMYVDVLMRGQGYAKSIIDFSDHFAKEHEAKALFMVTTASNERARNLYRKYGFKDMLRYDHYKFLN